MLRASYVIRCVLWFVFSFKGPFIVCDFSWLEMRFCKSHEMDYAGINGSSHHTEGEMRP